MHLWRAWKSGQKKEIRKIFQLSGHISEVGTISSHNVPLCKQAWTRNQKLFNLCRRKGRALDLPFKVLSVYSGEVHPMLARNTWRPSQVLLFLRGRSTGDVGDVDVRTRSYHFSWPTAQASVLLRRRQLHRDFLVE